MTFLHLVSISFQNKVRPKSPLIFVYVILLIIFQINGALSQTFPGTGGLAFPPSGTIGTTQSACNVTGIGILGGCKTIANVTIDLDHTWTGDIALILIAPNGTFIELSSANGGSGNDYKNTVFTDSAPTNIVSGSPPFTGSFRPEGRQNTSINNPYSNANPPGTFTFANTFNGVNADGAWTLYLNDYVGADVGFLFSWSITFTNGTNFTVDLGPDISTCAGSDVTVNATNTAPNPISYNWSNGATGPSVNFPSISSPINLTVTVTDQSGCTATDNKIILVNPRPTGNSITIPQCESTPPGQATFNLTASNSAIGGALSVAWFNDFGLTSSISNPNAFNSSSTTVYAVVSNANCSSLPIPIILDVTQIPANSYGMNIGPNQICQPGMVPVDFTLPSSGTYTYQYSLVCASGTENNSITTSNNPVMFNISGDCTLNISQITQGSTGCTTIFSPPLTDNIAIETPPSIMVNTMEICAGQSLNLADFVSSGSGSVLTFHTTTPPLPANQLPSTTVSPSATTTYYALAIGPNCSAQAPLTVNVVPEANTFTTTIPLCENSSVINLNSYVTPSNISGIWSGTGVTGSNFDPAGLQGNITLSFDPDNTCYLNGSLTIQLLPLQIPDLNSDDICAEAAPFDLSVLQDPAFPNGIWSGDGVSGTFFNPALLSGVINLTFTPTGQCVSPAVTTITINPLPQLVMEDNITVCSGASVNLTDFISNSFGNTINFYSSLPAIPANEILNTTVTITSSTNYFAQATDQNGCSLVIPFNVDISPSEIPVSMVLPLCENEESINLNQYLVPLNLTGTWNGSGVTGNNFNPVGLQGDIILTFDPVDICYQNGTITAQVTSMQTPALLPAQLCASSDPIDLNTLIDPAFPLGQWSGNGVAGNMFNPASLSGTINLTFTPTGQCVSPAMTNIEIFNDPVLQFNSNNVVCAGEMIELSTYVINPLGYELHYYSSLPALPFNEIINTSITISNTFDFYVLAKDANGCDAIFPFTINAALGESPLSGSISLCELDVNIDLSAYLNPPGLPGIWSGSGVNGNNFSPTGLQGSVLIHFDPDNLCFADGTINIDIIPSQNISLGTDEICSGSGPIDLTNLQDPNFSDGFWSGTGVTGQLFYPLSSSGIVDVTFTPNSGCAGPTTTSITITPEPFAQILNEVTVCTGANITLSDYIINSFGNDISFHTSLPAEPSNEVVSLNVAIVNTVQYFVKATDINGCIFVQPMTFYTVQGGTPALGFAVVCKNDITYNLNNLNDPLAGTGTWSGTGVNNNQLNLSSLSGIVSVTFTPENLCYEPATTYVEIRNPISLNLGTANLCSTSGDFNLAALADPLFLDGTWSGLGVSNGIFNPNALSGPVNLTFVSSAYCVNNATTTINIIASQTPILKKISICETIDTFNLSELKDPSYQNGIWSGTGVKDSLFISNGLSGINTVTFTSTQNCILPTTSTIEIIPLSTPSLLPFTICSSSDPIDLSILQDTSFSVGTWSGVGIQNDYFDPKGLSGKIKATFVSNKHCTSPATTDITVNTSPQTSNFKVTCDPTSRFYEVSFELSDGDPNSYMVNGISTGNQFISDTITSGIPYNFIISDVNQCNPTTLQGNKNCECITNAGTMSFVNTPIKVCKSDIAIATHFGDQAIDPNDTFSFILHDMSGLQVGNILAVSQIPQFNFPSNGILDKIYYISAIAGDSLTNGNVNQNDGCFSIAAGVPVIFYEPKATIDIIPDICVEDCTDIQLNFIGIPPFYVEFEITNGQILVTKDTITSSANIYKYNFCPSQLNVQQGKVNFKISKFKDEYCSPENLDSLVVFNVGERRITEIKNQLCVGEILMVNGVEYSASKPKGTEIIYSVGTGQCDSIIHIDLSFSPISTHLITRQICENQSVVVNGNTYDINKLSGIETIKNGNIHGCDSIINIQLTLVNEIVTSLNQTLCRGESVIVNGQVYDENRPSGSEIFLGNGSDKCDSTVNISLTFNEIKFLNINEILCADQSMIINGKTYDITHTEGTEVIKNGALNGCDSIINIKLSFYPIQTDTIVKVLKKGESIEINGILFNENNPKGITEDPVLTATGCQKFDYIIVYFEQDYITAKIETIPQSCPGENDGKIYISDLSGCSDYKLKINGTVYPNPTFPFELDILSPGSYQIEITGKTDCLMAKTVKILPSLSTGFTVSPIDFKMQFGQDVELHPEIIPAPSLVLWAPSQYLSCADCTTPMTRDISGDISFLLTLTDIAGCSFQYNIQLLLNKKDIEITFPNIFSPNGDGFNDFYEVKSTTSQQISRLTIFDRWGSQLFNKNREPDQESIIWDGKSHDKTIQPGVYIYLAEITDKNGNRKYVSGDLAISF